MGQKRFYEVKTVINGVTAYSFKACHSPKDFLQHATMAEFEKAKPGRIYITSPALYAQTADTIEYKPITKEYYESCMQTIAAGETAEETPASEFTDGLTYSAEEMDAEPGAVNDVDEVRDTYQTPTACDSLQPKAVIYFDELLDAASSGVQFDDTDLNVETVIPFLTEEQVLALEVEREVARIEAIEKRINGDKEIRLRLAVNDDMYLTGETVFDDDVIERLGFDLFLSKENHDAFIIAANAADYAVITPCDSMYRFLTASAPIVESIPEPRAQASITVPATVAMFVPKLSERQLRRKAGAVFGVQRSGDSKRRRQLNFKS